MVTIAEVSKDLRESVPLSDIPSRIANKSLSYQPLQGITDSRLFALLKG